MITVTVIDAAPGVHYHLSMRALPLLLLAYFIAFPWATRAQDAPAFELAGHATARDLVGHIEAHLDRAGEQTIDTVRDAPFTRLATRGVDFGYTDATIWLRMRLVNRTPDAEWRLHFRENFLPVMDVYTIAPGVDPVLADRTRITSTFTDRAVPYPEVTIPLDLPPGVETAVYVMYRSDGASQTSFELRARAAFDAYAAARTARNFVFYGMILFLAVAAALAFLITRLGVFAAYGAYAMSGLIFIMHADGNAFQYLWPNAPAFNNYASILTGTAFIVTGAMFARAFLQTARRHVVMDRLLLGVMLLAIAMVASTVVVDTQPIKKILVLLAFVGILLFTASGLVAARTRFREVRFYVFAWTGALAASAMMTSRHWFGIDFSEDTQLDAMRAVMVFDAALHGARDPGPFQPAETGAPAGDAEQPGPGAAQPGAVAAPAGSGAAIRASDRTGRGPGPQAERYGTRFAPAAACFAPDRPVDDQRAGTDRTRRRGGREDLCVPGRAGGKRTERARRMWPSREGARPW